jgi:hypothetical protein
MNCSTIMRAMKTDPLMGWTCSESKGLVRLVSPLRYADGGFIEVFVEERGDGFVVTDFGEAFRFLENHGIEPMRSTTRERLVTLAADLGGAILVGGDAIEVEVADLTGLMTSVQRLTQVVSRIADLQLSSRSWIISTFTDAVEEYLQERTKGVEIKRNSEVQGKAAKHAFDIVAKSSRQGISVIEAMSATTPASATSQLAFSVSKFADVMFLGKSAPRRYAVLDESAEVWTEELRRQLSNVASVVDWEKRDRLLAEL